MPVSEVPAFREYRYPVCYPDDLVQAPRAVRVPWPGAAAPQGWVEQGWVEQGWVEQGWVEQGDLVCPNHARVIDGSGACTRIPRNDPETPVPSRAMSVLVEERYGRGLLCPA